MHIFKMKLQSKLETTKYGGPDVAISSTWQQLPGIGCTIEIPPQNQTLRPMSSEVAIPQEHPKASEEQQDVTWDVHNDVAEDIGLTTPQNNS